MAHCGLEGGGERGISSYSSYCRLGKRKTHFAALVLHTVRWWFTDKSALTWELPRGWNVSAPLVHSRRTVGWTGPPV